MTERNLQVLIQHAREAEGDVQSVERDHQTSLNVVALDALHRTRIHLRMIRDIAIAAQTAAQEGGRRSTDRIERSHAENVHLRVERPGFVPSGFGGLPITTPMPLEAMTSDSEGGEPA
jgi:hypothetical protein